jgi:purine nucleoside phosphorylase
MDIRLGVIGGTGVYQLAQLQQVQGIELDTPYGKPSGPVRVGLLDGHQVAFLARHGEAHSVAPHRINYRANVHALHQLGVQRLLGINAVGGIGERMGPRVLAVPDQIIDYTHGRLASFCDVEGAKVERTRRRCAPRCCGPARTSMCGWSTAAAMARPRVRVWRPSPRLRGCAATAATWSA